MTFEPSRRSFLAAAALSENGHVAGIAAKFGDVVAHPLQRQQQVVQNQVARVCVLRTAQFGERQHAEDVDAVVECDHHDVSTTEDPSKRLKSMWFRMASAL